METLRYGLIGAEDLNIGTGTFEATLADGRVVTLRQINLTTFRSGSGGIALYDTEAIERSLHSTLQAALDAAGTKTRTLVVGNLQTISANTTVPSNVSVQMIGEGEFSINADVTLTINGPFKASLRQVFSGSGTATFGTGTLDTVFPQWFGATFDNVTDDRVALQAAFDSYNVVTFPSGATTFIGSTLLFNGNQIIIGNLSTIRANGAVAVLAGKNAATTRLFDPKIQDLTIENTDLATVGGIGLDFTQVTGGHVSNVVVEKAEVAILVTGTLASPNDCACYNRFYNVDAFGGIRGWDFGANANENVVFGGRVDGTTGIRLTDNTNNSFYAVAVEGPTTGVKLESLAVTNSKFFGLRFESVTTGFNIDSSAVNTTIFHCMYSGLTTDISDSSTTTSIYDEAIANPTFSVDKLRLGLAATKTHYARIFADTRAIVRVLNEPGEAATETRVRIEGGAERNCGVELYEGDTASGARNWALTTGVAIVGDMAIRRSSSQGGDPTTQTMGFYDSGNIKIAGIAVRATTEGTNHLDIFNGTAPVGNLTDGISLYSTSGELRVMDATANASLLSSHPQEIMDNADSLVDPFPFGFEASNPYLGKQIIVDWGALIRAIETISGKQFATYRDLPVAEQLSWAGDQEKLRLRREEEIRTAQRQIEGIDMVLANEPDLKRRLELKTQRGAITVPEPYSKLAVPNWMAQRGVQ